ncbi:HlyD family secretion protein [Enterocloster lavalensis]|uniref:HlyD family secretion protein n=1 Tax=Enterocloster lavalensis TaxID=460384 RepID=UPI001D79B1AE|nr:HlyD family secretion protein [Enterocloster lavalensis]MBS5603549.1 HlyD family secretion protein [Enterocloster asparagiformis]
MRRFTVGFLIVMVIFTFLSRALDSVTIARVQTGYGKQGSVSYRITGEGTFEADRLSYRPLPEGMRVDTILARPGDVVQAGDTILTLQMEPLQEKREELTVALRQAELALEQERLSGREIPRVTQEMLALQQMEVDQRALELGRQDLADAQEEYDQNVDALRLEYDRLADRSEDEIRQDARNALKSARRVYDAAKLDRDSAVKRAEREVREKQKKLDRLNAQEDPSEEAVADAEEALAAAEEDLELVKEEQDILVEEAKASLRSAEEDYDDRSYDTLKAQEDCKKAYEDGVKAEDEKLALAQRKVLELEEALRQSGQNLENARITDAGTRSEEEKTREISRLRQESMELDLEQKRRSLAKVEELISREGAVTAVSRAVVAGLDLQEGGLIGAADQIRLAEGRMLFRAQVDKEEAALLAQGQRMSLKRTGEAKELNAVVESVDRLSEDGKCTVSASLAEGEGWLGETCSFTVVLQSGVYPMVIPIEALREDTIGYFCLAVQPEKTILGEELTAVRVNVEVLEKSSTSAAVSGPVTSVTPLVLSSNKSVSPGDRVRGVTE